jgi:hypothetical protein
MVESSPNVARKDLVKPLKINRNIRMCPLLI